jgi:hypothetical protein
MGLWLMLSTTYCNQISKVSFAINYYMKITGYCYHLVNRGQIWSVILL